MDSSAGNLWLRCVQWIVLGLRVFRSAEVVHSSSGIRKRLVSHVVSGCEATQRPAEHDCNEHVAFQIRTPAFGPGT